MKNLLYSLLLVLIVTSAKAKNSWEGSFRLSSGETNGILKITECKNSICKFDITSTTGANACSTRGQLKIAGDRKSAKQIQSTKDNDINFNCPVTMTQTSPSVFEVEAKNSSLCCGVGAYFEGTYRGINAQPKTFKTSFNCKNATTEIEKMICSNELLAIGDITLAKEYKNALRNSKQSKPLKTDQEDWLSGRDKECEGKSEECVLRKYRDRILDLRELSRENPQDPHDFVIQSSIAIDYNPEVRSELESYRFDISTEEKANGIYSIEGWVLGLANYRVFLVAQGKNVWLSFKKDDDIKTLIPRHSNKNNMPKIMKVWIEGNPSK